MQERRASLRQKTFKGGTILYGIGGIDCVIRNLSATGAGLEISSAAYIPESFTLVIKPEVKNRCCQTVWRNGKRLGVAFT